MPDEVDRWQHVETVARQVFALYGYGEIRTPLFEKSPLFSRAVGETSDIVEKEMYTFLDRSGESLSLRPEGTASVVRAFIEHGLQQNLPWRVYYTGAMFRYERPQKGRFRQFHQIGCEQFGCAAATADVEMMAMLMRFFNALGLSNQVQLEINSLGCTTCRPPFRHQLLTFLQQQQDGLCDLCRARMERNPLRVLDCKQSGCQSIVSAAPTMTTSLC
ncbi:MAG: histidine--tRNA ligase, partial [Magnetococcales bacterium]|nr:histidine--tRNA ligase [Magnetococcales bacterium]